MMVKLLSVMLILATVYCTKNFANPRELLRHGSHQWQLALASHCSSQLGKQCFAKYGFIAGYMDS